MGIPYDPPPPDVKNPLSENPDAEASDDNDDDDEDEKLIRTLVEENEKEDETEETLVPGGKKRKKVAKKQTTHKKLKNGRKNSAKTNNKTAKTTKAKKTKGWIEKSVKLEKYIIEQKLGEISKKGTGKKDTKSNAGFSVMNNASNIVTKRENAWIARWLGKRGRMNGTIFGKRCEKNYRTVVTGDMYQNLDEMIVGNFVRTTIGIQEKVQKYNRAEMLDLMRNSQIPFFKIGENMYDSRFKNRDDYSFSNNMYVERYLRDNDFQIDNRQPTLHIPSMQFKFMKFLQSYNHKTMRLHFVQCIQYNADFDGDEMNAHIMEDQDCKAEAYELARLPMLSQQGDSVGLGHIQYSKWGAYKLTHPDTFFLTRQEFIQYMMVFGEMLKSNPIHQSHYKRLVNFELPIPAILKAPIKHYEDHVPESERQYQSLWTGAQLMSLTLMDGISYGKPILNLLARESEKLGPQVGLHRQVDRFADDQIQEIISVKNVSLKKGTVCRTLSKDHYERVSDKDLILKPYIQVDSKTGHSEWLFGTITGEDIQPAKSNNLIHTMVTMTNESITAVWLAGSTRVFNTFMTHLGGTMGPEDWKTSKREKMYGVNKMDQLHDYTMKHSDENGGYDLKQYNSQESEIQTWINLGANNVKNYIERRLHARSDVGGYITDDDDVDERTDFFMEHDSFNVEKKKDHKHTYSNKLKRQLELVQKMGFDSQSVDLKFHSSRAKNVKESSMEIEEIEEIQESQKLKESSQEEKKQKLLSVDEKSEISQRLVFYYKTIQSLLDEKTKKRENDMDESQEPEESKDIKETGADTKVNEKEKEKETETHSPDCIECIAERRLFEKFNMKRFTKSARANHVLEMILSGCKGNYTNLGQIAAVVGQQMPLAGRLVGNLSVYQKTIHCAKAHGFITTPFQGGMDDVSFFYGCISAWEGTFCFHRLYLGFTNSILMCIGLAIMSGATPAVGAQTKRFSRALSDLVVQADTSIRNSYGHLFQTLYGDNGMDPKNLISIPMKFFTPLKHASESLRKMQLTIFESRARLYEFSKTPPTTFWSPIHFQKWMEVALKMEIQPETETEKTITVTTQSFQEKQQMIDTWFETMKRQNVLREPPYYDLLLNTLLQDALSEYTLTYLYPLTIKQLKWILNKFEFLLHKAYIFNGTAIGSITAQAFGAPAMQISLNSKTLGM